MLATLARPYAALVRALDLLAHLFALYLRIWIGWVFLKSGLLKIESWDSTLALFQDEYKTPLLPPTLAAYAGTFGELFFPILVILGLAGRLGAIGLFAVNAMAVISYSHVLLAEGAEALARQHYLWGLGLLVIVFYGPGALSVDKFLARRPGSQWPV
jgi:putative oxidoreductase